MASPHVPMMMKMTTRAILGYSLLRLGSGAVDPAAPRATGERPPSGPAAPGHTFATTAHSVPENPKFLAVKRQK